MSKLAPPNPNQLAIPSYIAELEPERDDPGVDPSSRITMMSLIDGLGPTIHFGREPNWRSYGYAEPLYLNSGLYVATSDSDFRTTQHVIHVGVNNRSRGEDTTPDRRNSGVVFQPDEFGIVARNPHDLAHHTVNRTRNVRWGNPDRAETDAASMRSAGHALTSKINSQSSLSRDLQDVSNVLQRLDLHLRNPSKVRLRARTLELFRAMAVERIHDTAEVAVIRLRHSNLAIAGIHKAIKRNVYGGNLSHAQRTAHLCRYILMVDQHTHAKLYKIAVSRRICEKELEEYRPYLDAKEAREREQVQAA